MHRPTEEEALQYLPYETMPPEPVVPEVDDLTNLLRRFGTDLAVYFENMETGFVFRHNADRVFFGASVSKASFALYLFERALRGEIDLDETLTFTHDDVFGGSGIIVHRYAVGRTFSARELIRLNLSYSDNIATLILRRHYGIEGYRAFVRQLGANPNRVHYNIFNSNLSANDVGIFAREIYRFIAEENPYSQEFLDALLDNQFPFTISDYPLASKTGWTRPTAWHCMGIVYAPSPYVLVVLSAREGWGEGDFADFAEISMAFQAFNTYWFER